MSHTLWIASDHAGFALKKALLQRRLPEGWEWKDLGPTDSTRCDYPDFAEALAREVGASEGDLGVLICGSGIGMAIAANKLPGIRAAVVENPMAARLAREHNALNILCLGARFVAAEYAWDLLSAWFEATPSSDPRHLQRLAKITRLELA
jgi:ribose 5-phosphate isomerase B